MKAPAIFKTEADLCGAFKEFAERQGWTAYAETSGWDLLLVNDEDKQVGVQAKLSPNLVVIAQALEGMARRDSPAGAMVLVPVATPRFLLVCRALRFGAMAPNLDRSDLAEGWIDFDELLPVKLFVHPSATQGTCRLPQHVPDVPAGVPSPKVLSPFREKELRLCAILRRNGGYLRPKDFRSVGIDLRRWMQPWVHRSGPSKYTPVIGRRLPDEDPAFRKVAKQIADEVEEALAR